MKVRIKYYIEQESIEIDIDEIKNLPKDIVFLDLSNNNLNYFDYKPEIFPELKILILAYNPIYYFELPKNNKLEFLCLAGTKLTKFEIDYNEENLQSLDLNFNNLTEFKPNKKLLSLSIQRNKLKHFKPNEFLEYLNISENNLTQFKSNKNLKILTIHSNRLTLFEPNDSLIQLEIQNNNFSKQKISNRRRIYLLCESKVGTPEGLRENTKDILIENKEIKLNENNYYFEQKCYKFKKIINEYMKINIRKSNILNNEISFLSCC